MPDRLGTFYPVWPIIDGKPLQLQWGEIRSNTAETKAVVRNSIQQLGVGDELNALRARLGDQYGDLDFENSYRLIYDEDTQEFCLQVNNGTVVDPEWNDVWCIRRHDGQFQVVSNGGIVSAAGFYNFPRELHLVGDSHSLGTDTDEDITVLNTDRILFDRDSGLKIRLIDCGPHQGSPEVTFTAPFGRSQIFEASGEEWVVNHNFGFAPQMVQVMDSDDRVIIPDTVDVSDPNTAYFYFHDTVVGSVIIATGGLGAHELRPRDPFYLIVRTDNQSADTRTLRPNADLVFDHRYFYVEAHEDASNCRTHPNAFVTILPEIFYLNDLKDVTILERPSQGDVLVYEEASNAFVPKPSDSIGGAFYLNDLKDVDAPSANNGDALLYNATTGQWEPGTGLRSAFIHTQAVAAREWIVNHTQNAELLFGQVFDTKDRVIFPDVMDVSDPNVAYFYFVDPQAGKAILTATGAAATVNDHGGLTGLTDDDHLQYLPVDGSRPMTGDLDLGDNDIVDIGIIQGDLHVDGDVTAEAFYLAPGSGGEISKRGNDLYIRSRSGQVVIDDELRVERKVVAESYYLKDGGEVGSPDFSAFVRVDGTTPFTANQSMGGNRLTSVGAPTSGTDAARLQDIGPGFYGLTFGHSNNSVIFRGINTVKFNVSHFYVTQNSPNTDEVQINLREETAPATSSGITDLGSQATISGSSVDFTGIPSWVRRIIVTFFAVSCTGGNDLLVQIGTSSGLETSGYDSISRVSGVGDIQSSSGMVVDRDAAGTATTGHMILTRITTGNLWVSSHCTHYGSGSVLVTHGAGNISISGTLDRVRILVNGSNTFDNGLVTVTYE